MIRWLTWFTVGLAALTVLAATGLQPTVATRGSSLHPAQVAARDIRAEARDDLDRLQRALLIERVLERLVEARPDGGFVIESELPFPAADQDVLEEIAAAALGTSEGTGNETSAPDAGMRRAWTRIGFFRVDAVEYAVDREVGPFPLVDQIVIGTDDGTPFCIHIEPDLPPRDGAEPPAAQVATSVRRRRVEVRAGTALTGVCAWVQRYGVPGTGTARWLMTNRGAVARPRVQALTDEEARLGWSDQLDARPCLAGAEDLCEELFQFSGMRPDRALDRNTLVEDPGLYSGEDAIVVNYHPWGYSGFVFLWAGTLDALESEFGAERFARFWRSDESFDVAFRETFGLTPGAWLSRRLIGLHGTIPRGPLLHPTQAGVLLLSVGLGLGAASTFHRRRETS